ncbi:hypothetical protein JL720_15398 [Aureococcus anophagefferens]|nr:hypothetical protein JL720_15398 [Aureococcus anophagefferens]
MGSAGSLLQSSETRTEAEWHAVLGGTKLDTREKRTLPQLLTLAKDEVVARKDAEIAGLREELAALKGDGSDMTGLPAVLRDFTPLAMVDDVAAIAEGPELEAAERAALADPSADAAALVRLSDELAAPPTGHRAAPEARRAAARDVRTPAVEKAVFKGDDFACCGVNDFVRAMVVVGTLGELGQLVDAVARSPKLVVVRAKNRIDEPSDGGWRDVLLNVYHRDDTKKHVCEVQGCVEQMLKARKGLPGHVGDGAAGFSNVDLAGGGFGAADADAAILARFFERMGGRDWVKRGGWGTKKPLGDWDGVKTSAATGHCNKLGGAIPPTIAAFTEVHTLALAGMDLKGDVPSEITALANLHEFDASQNKFSDPEVARRWS